MSYDGKLMRRAMVRFEEAKQVLLYDLNNHFFVIP